MLTWRDRAAASITFRNLLLLSHAIESRATTNAVVEMGTFEKYVCYRQALLWMLCRSHYKDFFKNIGLQWRWWFLTHVFLQWVVGHCACVHCTGIIVIIPIEARRLTTSNSRQQKMNLCDNVCMYVVALYVNVCMVCMDAWSVVVLHAPPCVPIVVTHTWHASLLRFLCAVWLVCPG